MVGGCYQTSRLVARCTVRRPTDPDERTNALGFRIAASTHAARDVAGLTAPEWIDRLPDLDLDATVGVDRWTARPRRSSDPDGYAVITGYRLLALVPARAERPGLAGRGLLLTSEPLEVPPLGAGAYAVALEAGELVFRTRDGEVAATCPAPATSHAGAAAVEWWTETDANGDERDGLSLTAGAMRLDILPRTPLHGWR